MQNHLKDGTSVVSSHLDEYRMVLIAKDNSSPMAKPVEENQHLISTDKQANWDEVTHESQIDILQGQQHRKRPAQATLHLILMIADGILLIALLILVMIVESVLHIGG